MSIQFHCEHCGATIKAPDNAGGKKGRCPSCKQALYIPTAEPDQVEEMNLAPVDEAEERRLKEKVERDLAAEHDLFMAQGRTESPDDVDEPIVDDPHAEGGVVLPEVPTGSPRDLVVEYLASMAGGQLERAEAIAAQLRSDTDAAMHAIQQLTSDSVPDARIAKLPGPVLAGFLKQLEHELR